MMGQNWRPDFDPAVVRREIGILRADLHCNAVRLQGRDLGRLSSAAEFAVQEGLEVWFSPELWDHDPEQTVDYLAEAADVAQTILDAAPGKVVLSVGSELLLFGRGFVPGENVLERLAVPNLREIVMDPTTQATFGNFVTRLARTARERFAGKTTYASIGMERVDWGLFDFVAVDLYRGDPMFDRYPELLTRYVSMGKPFVNTEVGCCTFRGAERLGGRGWQAVDWSHWPPRLRGPYTYDQTAQANEVRALLELNRSAGAYGTFVFTFVEPGAGLPPGVGTGALASLDFDPDLPRYALVKTFPDGRRGTTYPDMPWEPKESFYAVADVYGRP
jgi:hypothetical protein